VPKCFFIYLYTLAEGIMISVRSLHRSEREVSVCGMFRWIRPWPDD